MNNKIIISDFDGTITTSDAVCAFLEKYAEPKWSVVEDKWRKGVIGSQECLKQQLALVKNISTDELMSFLNSVEIDKHFHKFCKLAERHGLKLVIVSDGFDLFIEKILEKYDISCVKVFANHLVHAEGSLFVTFPYKNDSCKINAGVCKCAVIDHYKNLYEEVFYVGDGVSDFCAAKSADVLFAKGDLAEYCNENDIDFIRFNTFKEVIENDRLGLDV